MDAAGARSGIAEFAVSIAAVTLLELNLPTVVALGGLR